MTETPLEFIITPRAELAGYDRVDMESEGVRGGGVRCRFSIETVFIYSIQVFTEYQGRGYGRATVDMFKERFEVLVADRVRFRARDFWEKMGFVDRQDGNWEYRRIPGGGI